MKKLILLMFCMVFLALPLVSADLDKISYLKGENGNNDLKVELFDTFLGVDFLWKTKDWGTAELKSHESVVQKRDVVVNQITEEVNPNAIGMYYDFSFNEIYQNGLGKVEFTDQRTGELVEREWRYVYGVFENWTYPVYSCVEDVCEQSGTETKLNKTWYPYEETHGRDIPKGDIIIGVEVEVRHKDHMDIVLEVGGKKLSKHAEYQNIQTDGHGETLNSDASDDGRLRGFEIKTRFPFVNTTGDYRLINVTKHSSSTATKAYLYPEGAGTSAIAVASFVGDVAGFDSLNVPLSNNTEYWLVAGDDGANYNYRHKASATGWNYIGTNIQIGATDNAVAVDYTDNSSFALGGGSDHIFSLISVTTGEENPPNVLEVTLLSPEDNANLTSQTNDFIWNVSDPESLGITNTTIKVFNSSGEVYSFTNSSGYEGSYTDSITLNDGDYSWNATAVDSTNFDTFSSATRSFEIDTTPTISVSSPLNDTNYSTSSIWFNATSDLSVDYWIINYNGTNHSIPDQSGTSLNELLTVEDGEHSLLLYANNSDTGVFGLNDSISFSVDTIDPQFTVNFPVDTQDYAKVNDTLQLNWSVSDTNLDTCWYNYNGTNITESCSSGSNILANITLTPTHEVTFYANDTHGNENSTVHTWDYKVFENSRTFTNSLFETETETYSINLTANSSLTEVNLFWNETSYGMSQSGNIWSFTRDTPIGIGDFDLAFNFTYGGNIINSSSSSQEVNETLFTPTNATYPDKFLSINFKDENDLSQINASVPTSSFTYYLGTGVVNKTLTFSNTTKNFHYNFSGTTKDKDLTVTDISFQYRDVDDYPQRIWNPSTQTYSNTTTNQTLYLLSTDDGIFVTYQVVDSTETTIEDVSVVTTRVVSGETIQVGAGETDSAGTVTFWLNPDFEHTSTFTHPDYDTFTFVHFPTQASYTITLGQDVTTDVSCVRGISETVRPTEILTQNEEYDFNYTVVSDYWNLTEFKMTLTYGNGTLIGSDTSTTSSGGTVNINNVNVSDSDYITMDYYYEIDSDEDDGECGQVSGTREWIVQSTTGQEFGIWRVAQDFKTYSNASLFGMDDFGKTLIAFVIIVLMVGGLSMRYGIASEGAIMGIMFGTVYMLDVGLGLIPQITIGGITAAEHFVTIITFIILFAVVLREEFR